MNRGTAILAAVGFATTFYLGDRITQIGRETIDGKTGNELMVALADVPTQVAARLPAEWLHVSTVRADLIGGAVAVGLLLLIVMYAVTGRRNRRPGEEQGSAAWGTPRDIAPFTENDPSQRIQLTATESLSIDTRKTQRNLNVLVIGGSGTGKTRSYIMPNLGVVDMSTATTDPKGEILREVGPTLEARGYDVRVLNLIDLQHSHHFNPFQYFDEENPETSVMQLAECIMANTSGTEAGKDQFWDRAERALLTSLIAYVWATVADQDDHEASLVDVIDLQKQMAAAEGDEADTYTSDVDSLMAASREIVAEYREAGGGEPHEDQIMNVLDFATRQYRTYEQGAGETKKSIIISLGVRLAPLDMYAIRKIIGDDDMAIDQLGVRPIALFLAIPDTHQTFRFLATIFWQTIFSHNIYLADHAPSGRLERPVHFFLDEFPNIGKIPGFDQLITTIRSRNMSASIVMQSHSQGKQMWDKAWPTIVGNCDSLLYLGGRDEETWQWISKQLGDQTIMVEETSRTYGASGSYNRSQRIQKRALMTPDEVGVMSNQMALLFVRGLRPFKSTKARLKLPV